jgi:hypothetical protein
MNPMSLYLNLALSRTGTAPRLNVCRRDAIDLKEAMEYKLIFFRVQQCQKSSFSPGVII